MASVPTGAALAHTANSFIFMGMTFPGFPKMTSSCGFQVTVFMYINI